MKNRRRMKKRFLALGAGFLAYVGLPYLLMQGLNLGLIREGRQAKPEVALTFDDGPDPVTTPAVLAALRAVDAKATFFVITDKAIAYPHLIQQMIAEGHEVAPHAVKHIHAWFRSPWGAFLEPIRAAKAFEEGTGLKAKYHRPPHGAYTLATILGQRKAGVTGVHWSLEGQDWQPNKTPEQIEQRLLNQVIHGAIIVLHDAGVGAKNTVPMLPDLLKALKARGYSFKTVSQLNGVKTVDKAAVKRRAFIVLDRIFDRIGKLKYLNDHADQFFRIGGVKFPFSGIVLNNGTSIPKDSKCTEFHVNNPLMVDISIFQTIRSARYNFKEIAKELQQNPDFEETQFVFCTSAMTPVLIVLGFESHDLPPSVVSRLRIWANILRWGYGTASSAPQPKLSILSREDFLKLYG